MVSLLLFRNETWARSKLSKAVNSPDYHCGRKTKFSMSLKRDIDIKNFLKF